jgi:hypothetical protein
MFRYLHLCRYPAVVFLLSVFACCQAVPALEAPVASYSDIDSGPSVGGQNGKGAFVTIYGHHFGMVRGASSVRIGDVAADNYPLWSDSKISFQLSTKSVSGSIVVSSTSGVSNALPFVVRKGHIYFVGPTGTSSGNGSFQKPWRSIARAAASMAPGDITYVLDGANQTTLDDYNAALAITSSGVTGAPKALVVYPGAHSTIGSATGAEYGLRTPQISDGPFNYWTLAGFTIRGRNEGLGLTGARGWRVVANDFSCPTGDGQAGCVEISASTYIKFYGNSVHDTSQLGTSKAYHSVYFTTDSNHIEVGWNSITNNHSCRGIQFHSSPEGGGTGLNQYDLSVHDNTIAGQICDGVNFATIDPSKGKVVAYNNLIYHVGLGPDPPDGTSSYTCIASPGITNNGRPGTGTAYFYNNTLYDCGARGGSDAGAFGIDSGSPTINLQNNLVLLSKSEHYFSTASQPARVNGNTDLWFGAGSLPSAFAERMNRSILKAPCLVRPGLDFALQPCSPAIGSATNVGLVVDISGNPRPSGGGYDIGAYQHVAAGSVSKQQPTFPARPAVDGK